MQAVKQALVEKYDLSAYQAAQLLFLLKTLSSEISKIIILAVIFHENLLLFFFALMILLILRCSTGGIHFYTYTKCLAGSILYFTFAITLLPHIFLPSPLRIILCVLCTLICYRVGPVPSQYRPPYTELFIKRCKTIITGFLLFYTALIYVIPESHFIIVGFWIIILHTLQLIAAKYTRKENS